MKHEEMVNTHIIKQRKEINTNHKMYDVENKYGQVEEGPASQRTNKFHTYRGSLPTVRTQLPQEGIPSLIQRPGAEDLLISRGSFPSY